MNSIPGPRWISRTMRRRCVSMDRWCMRRRYSFPFHWVSWWLPYLTLRVFLFKWWCRSIKEPCGRKKIRWRGILDRIIGFITRVGNNRSFPPSFPFNSAFFNSKSHTKTLLKLQMGRMGTRRKIKQIQRRQHQEAESPHRSPTSQRSCRPGSICKVYGITSGEGKVGGGGCVA